MKANMLSSTLKAIPTFRVLDIEEGKKFYIDSLGFTNDWEHRFGPDQPVYMQVSKGDLVLHLSDNPRFQTGSVVYVQTKGIDGLYEELGRRETEFDVPAVAQTPWGTKQMDIEDPFGNWLRFNEEVGE
jgi:catechol 2,3-dioxygenase-like lactoylglutathione lyase family enzyme